MDMWKLKLTVPSREVMKDNIYNAQQKQDYTQLIESQRKLAEYIQRREYWLWERKGVTPLINEHYRQ